MDKYGKYKIGVPEMDAQHILWIDLIEDINRILAANSESGDKYKDMISALKRLLDYTRSHFESEEKFLAARAYPGLAAHQKKHRRIERTISDIHDRWQKSRTVLAQSSINMLSTIWLMEHILGEDADYARFLANK